MTVSENLGIVYYCFGMNGLFMSQVEYQRKRVTRKTDKSESMLIKIVA